MSDLCKSPWAEWETVRVIGRGSFGTVYEIRRRLVDGTVETAAMKVITLPQNPGDVEELRGEGYDDESITATFQSHLKSIVAEYTLMRKLDGSANVVNCKDIRYIQHDDGMGWDIFIRMELLTPLLKSLPENVPEETVVRLGRDIASALVLCQKHNIIHRDIKPQNIFVSPNGDYKLGDFGIAKTVEKTMGGTKIGTYKYMAPEVYNNQPYGSGADIYSLGLVLYWLLNERRMPFMPLPPAKILAGQDEQARQRRLSGEKLPPPAHGSRELKQIVLKACAYDPKDRYHTADEMLEDLEALGGSRKGNFSPCQPEKAQSSLVEAKIAELLEAAKELHESNQYTKELGVLAEAYKLDRNNSLIMVQFGRCYRALNYSDKAMEFYSKAVEINPNEGAAYTNMAVIHLLRGEYEAAKKCYDKGMPFIDKGEFDYWVAQANYAVAIAKLGDVKKAEKMISEAEANGYSNGDVIRQMAGIKKKSLDDKTAGSYTAYADAQDETVGTQGVFGTAKTGSADSDEKGKKAQSFDRDSVLVETKIAELLEAAKELHESNQYTKELGVLAEAYKLDCNNYRIMVLLGRCYRALNYSDKAMEFYRKAVEINPNEGIAYTNMGVIHLLRGEYEAAKKCYDKGMPFIDKGEFDYWVAQASYAVAIAKLGDVKKAEKMISEAEANGYSDGDVIRQMAGIKKKSLFSRIFG